MGNSLQAHHIMLHQHQHKVMQQLKQYHEYKQESYLKHGYFRIYCPNCGSTADYRCKCNQYYCQSCQDYVDHNYWYSQSGIIWMFRKKMNQ